MVYGRHYVFLFHTSIFVYYIFMLIISHFPFDNDGMRSSKRQVTFLSLIFLLKSNNLYVKNTVARKDKTLP